MKENIIAEGAKKSNRVNDVLAWKMALKVHDVLALLGQRCPGTHHLGVKCQDIVDPGLMVKSATTSLTRRGSKDVMVKSKDHLEPCIRTYQLFHRLDKAARHEVA